MTETIGADGGTGKDVAIAISVYRPDMELLEALIARFASSVRPLYLHIDGPVAEAISAEELARLRHDENLRISQAETNRGIASALNRLAEAAKRDGHRFILYFDQDSEPEPGLPDQLLVAFQGLKAQGLNPAAIGPLPVPHDPTRSKGPRYRRRPAPPAEGSCTPVDYLITSGTLIELAALDAVGPFPESYRIDAVDIEWCFRAWSKGFSIWLFEEATMPHRIGSGVVRMGPIAFPSQNVSRMGTYVRNQFRMLRLGYVPARWKLRTLVYVPVQALIYAATRRERRLGTLGSLLSAAWSGVRGR